MVHGFDSSSVTTFANFHL